MLKMADALTELAKREAIFVKWATESGLGSERLKDLKRFAAFVRADQREACAKACDAQAKAAEEQGAPAVLIAAINGCGAEIRARGES